MIVQKLRGTPQRDISKNSDSKEGRKPFGTRPGEQEIIDRIVALRIEGLAFDTIAEMVTAENKSARAGPWHPTTIQRILARHHRLCD